MTFERRICSVTGIPISSLDKGSVQITLAELNQDGQVTGGITIYNISGCARKKGIADGLLLERIRRDEQREELQ
jgi:hypothetical protein